MTDDLQALKTETEAALAAATDLRAWDAVRVAVLGRNGKLTALMRDLGKIPARAAARARRRAEPAEGRADRRDRGAPPGAGKRRAGRPARRRAASIRRCRRGRARPA